MVKVWFVTGSTRGLGLALVEKILSNGDVVAATARKPDSLQHLAEKYGREQFVALPLDVTDNDQVLSAVDEAVKTFGRIDVVVNNAGYADFAPIEDTSLDSFRAQVDVNFLGAVHVTKAVLPVLRGQESGHVIQVSSIGGRVTAPGYAAYQAAKWALGGFSTCLQQEVAPLGIKVTVVEPGGMDTEWSATSKNEVEVSEPYRQTVGAFWEVFSQSRSQWSSPGGVADLIVKVAGEAEPPLRLLAGRDTIPHAKSVVEELTASDEKWRELTMSVK